MSQLSEDIEKLDKFAKKFRSNIDIKTAEIIERGRDSAKKLENLTH